MPRSGRIVASYTALRRARERYGRVVWFALAPLKSARERNECLKRMAMKALERGLYQGGAWRPVAGALVRNGFCSLHGGTRSTAKAAYYEWKQRLDVLFCHYEGEFDRAGVARAAMLSEP